MAVATYEAMMRPALEILTERGPASFRELAELVAERMGLTDPDRTSTMRKRPSRLRQSRRLGRHVLVQAGAVTQGCRINHRQGRHLLTAREGPVSNANLL